MLLLMSSRFRLVIACEIRSLISWSPCMITASPRKASPNRAGIQVRRVNGVLECHKRV